VSNGVVVRNLRLSSLAGALSSYPSARASAQELFKGADVCGEWVFALRSESVSMLGPRGARFDLYNTVPRDCRSQDSIILQCLNVER
jgi:hypothetical protein